MGASHIISMGLQCRTNAILTGKNFVIFFLFILFFYIENIVSLSGFMLNGELSSIYRRKEKIVFHH